MGSPFARSRLLVYALPLILIITMSTAVGAQGLFGMGFPGAYYLNGFWRGAVLGYGAPGRPGGGFTVYVGGSADYAAGTSFGFSALGLPIPANLFGFQHSYPNRGVWLGLALPIDIGPRLGLYASAWSLLRTGTVNSIEKYNGGPARREWNVDPRWTFVEGLAILRLRHGLNILGGLRYDHYTVAFKNPLAVGIGPTAITDEADINTENWIPLVGTQYENSLFFGSLVFRAVGFPALGGNLKYLEPFGGVLAVEGTGHYRRGYFLELFMEYAKKFGPGQLGVFARWNVFHAQSALDLRLLNPAGVLVTRDFDFSFNRSSWTLGGSVNLAFNMPY